MLRFYFYLNAALYAGSALWCTISPRKTAQAAGYVELNNSGRSEFLVDYGGLQWGLAAFFFYLGRYPAALGRIGAIFAVLLYAPIVFYRIATVVRFAPVSRVTYALAILEIALLIGAIVAVTRPLI